MTKEQFYNKVMPKIYGVGAAVVILGALAKIEHWPWGGTLLTIGMVTEVLVFTLFAFQPTFSDYKWEKIYPELAQEGAVADKAKLNGVGVSHQLDKMLSESDIDRQLVDNLGRGMKRLSENVNNLSDASSVVSATDGYTKNVEGASQALSSLTGAFNRAGESMSDISGAGDQVRDYHVQMQNMAKNLGSLNAVYELELQDANSHLKTMNQFYGHLSEAMQNLSEASKDSDEFKRQLAKLTENIGNLNNVYGNMLSAMKN